MLHCEISFGFTLKKKYSIRNFSKVISGASVTAIPQVFEALKMTHSLFSLDCLAPLALLSLRSNDFEETERE